jgi:hypothetical protein
MENKDIEKLMEILKAMLADDHKKMMARMDAWLTDTNDSRDGGMACQEKMEACLECKEPASDKMESEVEHREVPPKNVIVKPIEGWKKRHRGRKQAAGRREEPEEPNRGICGSRKKLAAACRKVSRRAAVDIPLQKNPDPRTLWTAEGSDRSRNEDYPLCRTQA